MPRNPRNLNSPSWSALSKFRAHLVPWKVLVQLLCTPHNFFTKTEFGSIGFRARNLSLILGLSNVDMYRHIRWLETYGYVSNVKISKGYVHLRLMRPANMHLIYDEAAYWKTPDADFRTLPESL